MSSNFITSCSLIAKYASLQFSLFKYSATQTHVDACELKIVTLYKKLPLSFKITLTKDTQVLTRAEHSYAPQECSCLSVHALVRALTSEYQLASERIMIMIMIM